ncbi:hypothetical protein IC582_026764 [Cucumis melo]
MITRLFDSPDDWECFLHYLGCLLEDDSNWCTEQGVDSIHPPKKVLCKISPLADELFDSRISIASAFIQRLQEDSNNKLLRGPFLANLEIERRKHMHGKGDDEKFLGALTDYYVRSLFNLTASLLMGGCFLLQLIFRSF